MQLLAGKKVYVYTVDYEKKISLTLSLDKNLDNLGSSKKHLEVFKRAISRMFEMTESA